MIFYIFVVFYFLFYFGRLDIFLIIVEWYGWGCKEREDGFGLGFGGIFLEVLEIEIVR